MSIAASFMKLIVGISNFLCLLPISYSYAVNKIFFWPWLLGGVESQEFIAEQSQLLVVSLILGFWTSYMNLNHFMEVLRGTL